MPTFKPFKILFVCLGNICRSPTAEGVMQNIIKENNLESKIIIDSAGTSAWHNGSPPDSRAIKAAKKRGYNISQQRSRKVEFEDFYEFDLILAADKSNIEDLKSIAPSDLHNKIKLILSYGTSTENEIPDPYYSCDQGFEHVLNLLENSCQKLLEEVNFTTANLS